MMEYAGSRRYRRIALTWIASAIMVAFEGVSEARSTRTLTDVLARSARYVSDYQELLSSVVAEERYVQRVESKSPGGFDSFGNLISSRSDRRKRELVSDYLLVRTPVQSGWTPFRDVYEVDGKPVRDRQERLSALFLDSPTRAWDLVATIAEESARFNLGSIRRTINTPTMALVFLIDDNQSRFEFRHQDTQRMESGETWVVAYDERQRPTLIRGEGDADVPAFGTFWIDADDGRIVRSRLRIDDGNLRSEIDVRYEPDAELDLWVPVEMRERYRTTTGETIEGTASYGHFRRFNVQTSERIK